MDMRMKDFEEDLWSLYSEVNWKIGTHEKSKASYRTRPDDWDEKTKASVAGAFGEDGRGNISEETDIRYTARQKK